LIARGFRLIQWNGMYALLLFLAPCAAPLTRLSLSDPSPLVNAHNRVFAILVGQPNNPTYANSTRLAYNALLRESMAAKFPASMYHHRRGLFAAVNIGLSYSQGQTAPSWLHNGDYNPLADRLLANEHVARMATFASGELRLAAAFLDLYSWRHS
jgi:hypothetical protein